MRLPDFRSILAMLLVTLLLRTEIDAQTPDTPSSQASQNSDTQQHKGWGNILKDLSNLRSGSIKELPKRIGKEAQSKAEAEAYRRLSAMTTGSETVSPIFLDASRIYKPEVVTPENFHPIHVTLTKYDLFTPLPPGDYSFDVIAACMQASVHMPGQGIGYQFSPLLGSDAAAIATLFLRGTMAKVPLFTLQNISWQLQVGITPSQMPEQHRQIVHKLIPTFETTLEGGDFVAKAETFYHDTVEQFPGEPPFRTFLKNMGVAGEPMLEILRQRDILRKTALDYELTLQLLHNGLPGYARPATPQASPWMQKSPGVLMQVVIEGGNLHTNRVNVRILPPAQKVSARQKPELHLVNAAFFQLPNPVVPEPLPLNPSPITAARIFNISTGEEITGATAEAIGAEAIGTTVIVAGIAYVILAVGIIAFAMAAAQALLMTPKIEDETRDERCERIKKFRDAYTSEVTNLKQVGEQLLANGQTEEQVAKELNQLRREIGSRFKNLTPEPWKSIISARNQASYGDPLGPTWQYLRGKGYTWGRIIASSAKPDGSDIIPQMINATCGYDVH